MSFTARLAKLERARELRRESRRQQALDACLRLSPLERAQQLLALLRRAAKRSGNPAVASVDERATRVIDNATATAFLLIARRNFERFMAQRGARGMAPNGERLPGSR